MKKLLNVLVIAIMVVVSAFSFSNSSKAAEENTGIKKLQEQVDLVRNHSQELSDSQLVEVVQIIENKIQNKEIKVVGNDAQLNFDKIKAYAFDETQENAIVITIPYKNVKGVSVIENLTLVFDETLSLVNYSEAQVDETATKVKTTVYIDGKETGSTEITKESKKNGEVRTSGYMDRVVDCMKDWGVTAKTAESIIASCGLVCAVTLGTLCTQCLGFFGTAGLAVAVGCFISER
ncbi:MAG: hypothetical protein ACQEW5_28280 [Bacillota bacterium]